MSQTFTAPSALPLAKRGRRKLPRSYRLTSPGAGLADEEVMAVGGSPNVMTAAAWLGVLTSQILEEAKGWT
jgi:hypothetical protein